jgi:hypothetical protein
MRQLNILAVMLLCGCGQQEASIVASIAIGASPPGSDQAASGS